MAWPAMGHHAPGERDAQRVDRFKVLEDVREVFIADFLPQGELPQIGIKRQRGDIDTIEPKMSDS